MDQLNERNTISIEVRLQFLAKEALYLVIDDSDTSTKRLVNISQNFVLWIKNVSRDFDRGRESRAHDCLDGLRVRRGQGQTIAVSVDAGWINGVWINLLQCNIIVEILFRLVISLFFHVVFDSQVSQLLIFKELVNLILNTLNWCFNVVGHLLKENGILSKGEVCEELKLLHRGKQVEVLLEGLSELITKDSQSRDVDKKITDVSMIE